MVRIDGYLIDAAITETHELEAEPTSYPTESGSDYTDNVRRMPRKLSIEGIVSDTPTGLVEIERRQTQANALFFSGAAFLPSLEALAKLDTIYQNGEPVVVETSLRTYERMVLVSLSIPRDRETGDALRFTADFQELRIIENRRTTVALPRNVNGRNLGARSGKIKEGAGSIWFDSEGRAHLIKYDPVQKRFVDDATKRPLTPEEGQDWFEQQGMVPKKNRDVGPGGYNAGDEKYWPHHTEPADGSDTGTGFKPFSSDVVDPVSNFGNPANEDTGFFNDDIVDGLGS